MGLAIVDRLQELTVGHHTATVASLVLCTLDVPEDPSAQNTEGKGRSQVVGASSASNPTKGAVTHVHIEHPTKDLEVADEQDPEGAQEEQLAGPQAWVPCSVQPIPAHSPLYGEPLSRSG